MLPTTSKISNQEDAGAGEDVDTSADAMVTTSQRYTTEVNMSDVLLGRGVPIFNHPGNIRFRQIVQGFKGRYTGVSRHQDKNDIAQEIIRVIEVQNNGRFLREVKTSAEARSLGIERGTKAWSIVSEADKVKKVKQTLRDPFLLQGTESDDDEGHGRVRVRRRREEFHEDGKQQQRPTPVPLAPLAPIATSSQASMLAVESDRSNIATINSIALAALQDQRRSLLVEGVIATHDMERQQMYQQQQQQLRELQSLSGGMALPSSSLYLPPISNIENPLGGNNDSVVVAAIRRQQLLQQHNRRTHQQQISVPMDDQHELGAAFHRIRGLHSDLNSQEQITLLAALQRQELQHQRAAILQSENPYPIDIGLGAHQSVSTIFGQNDRLSMRDDTANLERQALLLRAVRDRETSLDRLRLQDGTSALGSSNYGGMSSIGLSDRLYGGEVGHYRENAFLTESAQPRMPLHPRLYLPPQYPLSESSLNSVARQLNTSAVTDSTSLGSIVSSLPREMSDRVLSSIFDQRAGSGRQQRANDAFSEHQPTIQHLFASQQHPEQLQHLQHQQGQQNSEHQQTMPTESLAATDESETSSVRKRKAQLKKDDLDSKLPSKKLDSRRNN